MVEGDLSEDRVIPVNTIDMYEVIADFEAKIRAQQIARVNKETEIRAQQTARVSTKYKTVDRKVKPVAAPLLEDS